MDNFVVTFLVVPTIYTNKNGFLHPVQTRNGIIVGKIETNDVLVDGCISETVEKIKEIFIQEKEVG